MCLMCLTAAESEAIDYIKKYLGAPTGPALSWPKVYIIIPFKWWKTEAPPATPIDHNSRMFFCLNLLGHMRHACCLDNLDRCWCWGDMICLGISWNGVTAVGHNWSPLGNPWHVRSCGQIMMSCGDRMRNWKPRIGDGSWWIHGDAIGWDSHYFPLVSTCQMTRNSMISPRFTQKKGRLVKRSSLRQVASLTQQLKELQTEQEEQDGWHNVTLASKKCHAVLSSAMQIMQC